MVHPSHLEAANRERSRLYETMRKYIRRKRTDLLDLRAECKTMTQAAGQPAGTAINTFERTEGAVGRSRVTIALRKTIMQVVGHGVSPAKVPMVIDAVLALADIHLSHTLKRQTCYHVSAERGPLSDALIAKTWMGSSHPKAVTNQSDGTSFKNANYQAELLVTTKDGHSNTVASGNLRIDVRCA